jgi:hypothetical protein
MEYPHHLHASISFENPHQSRPNAGESPDKLMLHLWLERLNGWQIHRNCAQGRRDALQVTTVHLRRITFWGGMSDLVVEMDL